METLVQKVTGFRFIVFMITAALVGSYITYCDHNKELIQLQGIVLGVVGMATALIGGKTYTDIKGKK
jgi:hypothetical protein